MTTGPTGAELLAAAQRSPEAAARHDRAAWVELFTPDGTVEDPVGSAPHRGHSAIRRFYDTFIAPRDIAFHVVADIVCGTTVIREVTLEIRMGAGVTMQVPAILRYAVSVVDGELKIAQLQAFWELPPMLWQFARKGVAAAPVAVRLVRDLVSNQRLGGTVGFMTGLHRPAQRQRAAVDALLGALTGGDQLTTRRLLATGARVALGDHEPLTPDGLVARLRGARQTARITAGPTTAVSLRGDTGPVVLLIDVQPWTVRCYMRE